MTRIAALERRSGGFLRLCGFPVLYLGWAYAFWSPLFVSTESVWSSPNVLLFLTGGASPLLAGVAMSWVTGGRDRVRDLAWRLVDVRRISRGMWLAILAFWPIFDVTTASAGASLGLVARPFDVAGEVFADPSRLAFLLLLSFVLPAAEEVGLRGYYLDALQERFPPAVAAVINGATWALWHAPFVCFPAYYADTGFQPELWWWMPSIVLQTVLFVWVYNQTQRSILAVLVLHGMMNLTGELLGLAPQVFPVQLPVLACLAAAAAVGLARSGQAARREPARRR